MAHYTGLSDTAGVRAPPGLFQFCAQLKTINPETMWHRHLRAWPKRSCAAWYCSLCWLGVPKHKKADSLKRNTAEAAPGGQMWQEYQLPTCAFWCSGCKWLAAVGPAPLWRPDYKSTLGPSWLTEGLLHLLTHSHTHTHAHAHMQWPQGNKSSPPVANEICWHGIIAGQQPRPLTMWGEITVTYAHPDRNVSFYLTSDCLFFTCRGVFGPSFVAALLWEGSNMEFAMMRRSQTAIRDT